MGALVKARSSHRKLGCYREYNGCYCDVKDAGANLGSILPQTAKGVGTGVQSDTMGHSALQRRSLSQSTAQQ